MERIVGIIGDIRDIHVYTLKKRLEDLHCRVIILNLSTDQILFKKEFIKINKIKILNIDAFYVRQIPYYLPKYFSNNLTMKQWYDAYDEFSIISDENKKWVSIYGSIIKMISDEKLVINPFDSLFFQRLKPFQFFLLKNQGIPIPSYIVTNDYEKIAEYKDFVYKPLCSYSRVEKKTENELKDIIEERAVILQRFLDGRTIRVSILDEIVIGAVEILHKKIDSRIGPLIYKEIKLNDHVREILIRCMKILGFIYSEIDVILVNEEAYVLDCNPSPGFMVLEQDAGIPTSTKIAEYIIEKIK